MHFSVFVSSGSDFHILGPAAEKDDLRICVFLQKSDLDTQSQMISIAFHDVWMVIVPEGMLVLDCSYIFCMRKAILYVILSFISNQCNNFRCCMM